MGSADPAWPRSTGSVGGAASRSRAACCSVRSSGSCTKRVVRSALTARTAALLTIAGWLTAIEILPELRPQEFAFALFALCLWALATRRDHPWRVWVIPAAMLPWANIHGSFPLGLVLLGFAWLEDRRDDPGSARRILLALAAGLALTFVNPFGVRVWSYVFDLSTHPVVSRRIAEWGPPSIHTWTGRFFFASLLAVGAWLARRPAPTNWLKLLQLGLFALLSLLAIRGVVWWALVTPVIVASILGPPPSKRREPRSLINAAVVATLVLLSVVSLPVRRGIDTATGGPAVLTFAPESLVAAAQKAVPAGSQCIRFSVAARRGRSTRLPASSSPSIPGSRSSRRAFGTSTTSFRRARGLGGRIEALGGFGLDPPAGSGGRAAERPAIATPSGAR